MGQAMIVPENDDRMEKLTILFHLTELDVAQFYQIFAALDVEKTGLLPITTLFESIEFTRNMYTDSLFELLDIDYSDGEVSFSEFLDVIMTYCMFERNEIFKFCLHIFDDDKAEAITEGDLKQLMDVVHNVTDPGDHVRGNPRLSWNMLTFADDGVVSFDDLIEINKRFPTLLAPVFMMQAKMMVRFMGELWWKNKKNLLLLRKEGKITSDIYAEKKRKKNSADNKARQRKIKRNMGILMYLICPCWRSFYDPTAPEDPEKEVKEKREKEAKEQAQKKLALDSKNPETTAWLNYEKKAQVTDYVINKHVKTERYRESRAEGRANRKAIRKNDDDLKHKFTS